MSQFLLPLVLADLANKPPAPVGGFAKIYLRADTLRVLRPGSDEQDLVLDRTLDAYRKADFHRAITPQDSVKTALQLLEALPFGAQIKRWVAGKYDQSLVIVERGELLYELRTDTPLPFYSTDFDAELLLQRWVPLGAQPDLSVFAQSITLGGTRHPVELRTGNVNLNDKFFDKFDVPYLIRQAVVQGQYENGELLDNQPEHSRIEMSFTTRTDKFIFERGHLGTLVWCRYPKR